MAISIINKSLSNTDKTDITDKLKRVEGRIKGIVKMINDERQTEDVMMQLAATYESMRVAMKILIKQHMENSMSKGLISTNTVKKNEAYDRLLNDIFKYVR